MSLQCETETKTSAEAEVEDTESPKLLHRLASTFKQRAEIQGWTGKQRDKYTLEFFLGAWAALPVKSKAATAVGVFTSLVVATRGYAGLDLILKDKTDPSMPMGPNGNERVD